MTTKVYCDRCDAEMSYSRCDTNFCVYHEKKDLSFSLSVRASIIANTKAGHEICETCVRELIIKAVKVGP